MSRSLRVIVCDADSKAASVLAFGFEREAIQVEVATSPAQLVSGAANAQCAIVGPGADSTLLSAIRTVRSGVPPASLVPVIAIAEPARRAECLAAGASDFLSRPTYIRDVVALARFAGFGKGGASAMNWSGDLAEFAAPIFLLRALSSAGRTGVMTFMRGLRRGEVRFYQGEVTSAQVGGLHGLAGLHQLILWADGKVDFRAEPVVRRQQIPLDPARLFEDLSRFIRDFHELAPELAPASVLAQEPRRLAEATDKIPKEIIPVLRLFDGHRPLCDIIEDSPFRVFETVKIAARLVQLGVLRASGSSVAHPAAALSSDDWLGRTPPAGVTAYVPRESPSAAEAQVSAETTSGHGLTHSERRRQRREGPGSAASTSPPASQGSSTSEPVPDWGPVPTPAASVWDVPGYAPVVPSQVATGEIGLSGRSAAAGDVAALATGLADVAQAALRMTQPDPATTGSEKVLVDISAGASEMPTAQLTPPGDGGVLVGALHTRTSAQPAPAEPATSVVVVDPVLAARAEKSNVLPDIADESSDPALPKFASGSAPSTGRPAPAPPSPQLPSAPQPTVVTGAVAPSAPTSPVGDAPQPPVSTALPATTTPSSASSAATASSEPSALSAPSATTPPATLSPPSTVTDAAALAAARSAAAAAGAVTRALAFDDIEESFFAQGSELAKTKAPPVESFEDLEPAGARPAPSQSFWQRLFGSPRRTRPSTPPPGRGTKPGAGAKPGSTKPTKK